MISLVLVLTFALHEVAFGDVFLGIIERRYDSGWCICLWQTVKEVECSVIIWVDKYPCACVRYVWLRKYCSIC